MRAYGVGGYRCRIGYETAGIEQFHQALRGTGGPQQLTPHLGDGGDAHSDHDGVEHEGAEFAAAHPAADDVLSTLPQHARHACEQQQDGAAYQQRALPDPAAGNAEGALHLAGKGARFELLLGVALHHANVLDDLAGIAAHAGDTVLALVGQAPHLAPEYQNGRQNERHSQRDDQAELEVGDEHHHQRAAEGQAAAQCHAEGGSDNGLQQGGVGGQAGHDLAAAI